MIEGLRRNGVEVVECHEALWHGIEDRVQAASGGWLRPAFWARVFRTYWRLLRTYRTIDDYDIMVVGYPGQLDVYMARLLTWLRRKPLVLDVFMSIYLIALERGLTEKSPGTARLIYGIEKLACLLPDRLILDTARYVEWFHETYGVDQVRFRLVPTGADDRVFRPREVTRADEASVAEAPFRVLYYGTFIPNHGVKTIVEAAMLLRNERDIRFELIGEGPTKAQGLALAERHGLDNVDFVGWVDKQDLPYRAARADVCLGVFGTTPQSVMTVQNKIYEGLAMKKPVITGDAAALRAHLRHGEHVWVCGRANPKALAEAILTLKADPDLRNRLAESGHEFYRAEFDLQHNGARYAAHLRELAESRITASQ
jgi:glycosyltransferase involved in cell wall biosynthesis